MTPDERTISEILSLEDDKAKIAMIQLYTKQQCIAFAEWVGRNEYHYYPSRNTWGLAMAHPQNEFTTEEVYTEFLNQSK